MAHWMTKQGIYTSSNENITGSYHQSQTLRNLKYRYLGLQDVSSRRKSTFRPRTTRRTIPGGRLFPTTRNSTMMMWAGSRTGCCLKKRHLVLRTTRREAAWARAAPGSLVRGRRPLCRVLPAGSPFSVGCFWTAGGRMPLR